MFRPGVRFLVHLLFAFALSITADSTQTSGAQYPSGLYCGTKTVDLMILRKSARISAVFKDGAFAFKVNGDVVVKPCSGNGVKVNSGSKLAIDEEVPRTKCLEALLNEHGVELNGMTIEGNHPMFGQLTIKTSATYNANEESIQISATGVPLLGSIDVQLAKSSCKKRKGKRREL